MTRIIDLTEPAIATDVADDATPVAAMPKLASVMPQAALYSFKVLMNIVNFTGSASWAARVPFLPPVSVAFHIFLCLVSSLRKKLHNNSYKHRDSKQNTSGVSF